MIYFAKIISIVLAVFAITKTYLDLKKRNTGIVMFLFWTITWLAIILLSLYPILVEKISTSFGDSKSGMTALFSISFVFIYFVTYRIYIKANRLEKKIQEIVIKSAIKDSEKE